MYFEVEASSLGEADQFINVRSTFAGLISVYRWRCRGYLE